MTKFLSALVTNLLVCSIAWAQTQTATPWCIRNRVMVFNTNGFVSQTPDVARDTGNFDAGQDGASRRGLLHFKGTFYHVYYDNSVNNTHVDLYFRTSKNGITWTPKVRISIDSATPSSQFWPVLVAWGGGATPVKLGLIYRDNRATGPISVYFMRSINNGQTWSTPRRIYAGSYDEVVPDLAVSAEDSLYASMSTAQNSFWQGMQFSSSRDGGQTWRPWRIVYNGGNQYTRLSNMETGPGGHIWMGAAEDQFQRTNLRIVHSADYGRTWDAGVNASQYSAFQDIVYSHPPSITLKRLPNGTLTGLYTYIHPPGPFNSAHYMVKSTNNGATWATPVRLDDVLTNKYLTLDPVYLYTSTMAVSTAGTIYAAYADDRRHSVGPRQPLDSLEYDVYLTRSTDNGATWSAGRRVNTGLGKQRHGFPMVAVKTTGTTDSVLVTWLNFRFQSPLAIGKTIKTAHALRVWPNPSSGLITVAWTQGAGSLPAQIEVYNLLGKRIRTISAEGLQTTIDVSDLAKGMYTVKMGAQSKQVRVE